MPTGHDASPETLTAPFVPNLQQLRYLNAWLDPTAPTTINGLAAIAKVQRRNVYRWINDPAFCLWFSTQVERFFTHDRHIMWKRCLELAKAGSPEHIKLLAQRSGELRPEFPGNNPDRTGGMQVFINVPRPALPQSLIEDANTIDVQQLVIPVTTPSTEQ